MNAGLRLRLIGEDFHPAVFGRSGVKSGDGAEGYFLIRVRHLVTEQQKINQVHHGKGNKHGDDNSFQQISPPFFITSRGMASELAGPGNLLRECR